MHPSEGQAFGKNDTVHVSIVDFNPYSRIASIGRQQIHNNKKIEKEGTPDCREAPIETHSQMLEDVKHANNKTTESVHLPKVTKHTAVRT